MSYLVDLVVKKNEDNTYKWAILPAFGAMLWKIGKRADNGDPVKIKETIRKANQECMDFLNTQTDHTTEEKLKTAPCDAIVVITGEDSFEYMKDRNPINLRDNPDVNLLAHLKM